LYHKYKKPNLINYLILRPMCARKIGENCQAIDST
jgi:hypothetical protein